MAGFGRSPFGRGPFGRSDVGRDLIIQSFPVEYFDDSLALDSDETPRDNDKDPLLKLLRTYGFQVSNRRIQIDGLDNLLDPEEMPLEIVRLWGEMLGLGIDKNDPEFLQRSLLANASQWLQIKASIPGYEVRGLASGFNVTIDNYWRIDPVYASLIPARFLVYLKPKLADASAIPILHTSVPPGTYPGTPTEEDNTYAKSAYLRCIFEVAEPRRINVDYNFLVDLVIYKILDVVGIHHELLPSVFQIRIPIEVNENTDWLIHETSTSNASQNYIYDITPADEIATDNFMSVTMVVGDGIIFDVPVITSSEFYIDEQPEYIILPVPLDISAEILQIDESGSSDAGELIDVTMSNAVDIAADVNASANLSALFDEFFGAEINQPPTSVFVFEEGFTAQVDALTHFDLTPADEATLDTSGTVTIQIYDIYESEGDANVNPGTQFIHEESNQLDLGPIVQSVDLTLVDGIVLEVPSSPAFSQTFQEFSSTEVNSSITVSLTRGTGYLLVVDEPGKSVSIAASEVMSPVVSQAISVSFLSDLVLNVYVSPSVAFVIQPSEQSILMVVVPSITVGMTASDNPRINVPVSYSFSSRFEESLSGVVNSNISVGISPRELGQFTVADPGKSVSVSAVEQMSPVIAQSISVGFRSALVVNVFVSSSVSFVIEPSEQAILMVVVPSVTVGMTASDNPTISVAASPALSSTFSESLSGSASASITAGLVPVETIQLIVSDPGRNIVISASEVMQPVITQSITVSFRSELVLNVFVSPSVSFLIQPSEQSTISVVNASLGASVSASEGWSASLTQTLNTSFGAQVGTTIPVSVAGSTGISRISESVTSIPVNASAVMQPVIRETAQLFVDGLTHFDLTMADVVGLDSSGYVTISVTIGP